MITARFLVFSVLLATTTAYGQLDPTAHVSEMKELVSLIRPKLPKNWKIEATPFREGDVAKSDWKTRHDPHIVVYSDRPVVAIHKNAISFVIRKPTVFLLKYRLEPMMPDKAWTDTCAENKTKNDLRAFYISKLDHTRDKTLKGSDYDPENHHPTTDRERQALQEYYFVWPNTHTFDLLAFHYKSLSVWSTNVEDYTFYPEDVGDDYRLVAKAIAGILTAYKPAD